MITIHKTINFLGDSITAGAGASSPDRVFHQILKKELQLKEANNFGVSGTRIARQKVPSSDPLYDEDFLIRAKKMPKADFIFVFGGTNDWGHGDSLFGDYSDESVYTFCGACNNLFDFLKSSFPNSVIITATPLPRLNHNSPFGEGARQNGRPLKDYAKAIRDISAIHNLPCLDLFDILSYFDPNIKGNENTYLADGIHPNDKGHYILSKVVSDFISKL